MSGQAATAFHKGQAVLIRVNVPGQGVQRVPGTIISLHGKAAKVKTAKFTNYEFYSQLEPDPDREPPPKPPEPLATIGDKVRLVEPEPSRPPVVLIRPEGVQQMAEKKKRKPYVRKHGLARPTPIIAEKESRIGRLMRQEREAVRMGQGVLAKIIGLRGQSDISRIELGRSLASDEVLLKFQERFPHLDLSELNRLRDEDARERPLSAAHLGIKVTPRAAPKAKPAPAPAPSLKRLDYDFIDRLCEVVPMPADRDKRRVWLELAERLRGLL